MAQVAQRVKKKRRILHKITTIYSFTMGEGLPMVWTSGLGILWIDR
jgi:hypothetical protein